MKKGKFIVVDGIDGSGKNTQTKAIVEKLKENNQKVEVIDFPQYDNNFFGKLISQYLAGELGSGAEVSPYIASVLYAADRFESSKKIKKWLDSGFIVIADRYVSSNQIHQGGKIKDSQEREKFLKWLNEMEYNVFEIPKPNAIFYLNVSCAVSGKLLDNKDALGRKKYAHGKKDIHESDANHMNNARESALKLVEEENNWINIECMKNGKMLPIRDITDKIWLEIKPFVE